MKDTSTIGKAYEQLAAKHVSEHGLSVIHHNYRSKLGEIDLIAKDHNTLVFIEVKYRKTAYFGSAAEQVTASKRLKLQRCAEHYLQHHNPNKFACRFDVIGIDGIASDNSNITWLKNAF